MYKTIIVEKKDGVVTMTMNRPEAMNAINLEMMAEMTAVVNECEADDETRVLVITGAGDKAFSAGGDVKWMNAEVKKDTWKREWKDLIDGLNHFTVALRGLPKPTIAAVNGFAAGAGFSIALACDLRVVSPSAKFNEAYAAIGLTPDGGSSYFLTNMIGVARAMELILSARIIDAQEANELGLVTALAEADGAVFQELVEKTAKRYAQGPTAAYGRAKKLVYRASYNDLRSQLDMECDSIFASSLTGDFVEGLEAFAEKRKPDFKGN